ncbi:MAG: N-acetyl-gamma-glutamyl-phosphate reductase [Candidatus Caldatribacterium sp.]|uniref:N-acetyl-gamma-glutamyl-phosphate reductase n=1 Tax=Candidatus Caldatribacterium sp. TaxID=2282143 RepID=UPI0029939ED6|nr:N-acetyl-gamma-glutamyl-phosphate reductase [Candidatus Caldatribacterium sp.]MCX7729596.1 N-acetyl-gamma-glutamyl-phosphate reductase [Candidatus Caldatribacterium sp.]MDW8080721.1 N-acetyl-gamma-glutamyl-phosphate reductase [Candidatus Calescibacterium sp.]
MIRVGILGGTGYTGLELLRILAGHPEVEIQWIHSERFARIPLEEYCPAWRKRKDLVISGQEVFDRVDEVDVVFVALPHGVAMEHIPRILGKTRVIDLSADFRLQDPIAYETWYKIPHKAPDLLPQAVYGIPEIYRTRIQGACLVANPGCYPTSVVIPLFPFVQRRLLESPIIVDSKSGVSGAGRKASEELHFCEVNENCKAYGVGIHRHTPEITEQLSSLGKEEYRVIFVPHLLPLKRGIVSTIYATLRKDVSEEELLSIWEETFAEEPWVRVLPKGYFPELKWVIGSNFIDIGLRKVGINTLVVIAAIDNLTKGASGQAVQNLNIMFGIDERIGLPTGVLYP